jgi:hypothetical protein
MDNINFTIIPNKSLYEIIINHFPVYNNENREKEIDYVVAGEFALFLKELIIAGKDINQYIKFIEELIIDPTIGKKEIAIIRILEAIQNTFSEKELGIIEKLLLSNSSIYWNKLNAFWDGNIQSLEI